MSNTVLKNSSAIYETFMYYKSDAIRSPVSPHLGIQSSSVTSSGRLGDLLLLQIQHENTSLIRHYERTLGEDMRKRQKHLALLHLLDAWSKEENEEEEQPDGWERLKQALDEDRISGRKLFP